MRNGEHVVYVYRGSVWEAWLSLCPRGYAVEKAKELLSTQDGRILATRVEHKGRTVREFWAKAVAS